MTERPELNDDFADLLRAFHRHGVEFVVVGAHAMAAHGVARATGDLDVLVRPSAGNATRTYAALLDFGAPLAAHGVEESDFAHEGSVYQMGLPPRRIDVLTSVTGVDFEQVWQGRMSVQAAGLNFPVMGKDALIRNKRAAGRDKDLVDVKLLEQG